MSKKREIPWQCRQGDVFLERVEAPAVGKEIARDAQGRIVLAHGEATGHAHVVRHPRAKLLELAEDHTKDGDAAWANVLGILRLAGTKGAALVHDCPGQVKPDHDPIHAPAGDYAVIQQVTYTPEAIVTVQD